MRGKYSKKKEVKEELENMNQEEQKEKKHLPKWLKIGLGVVGGVAAAGGAYLIGEHKGASLASSIEDFGDDDEEDDFFDEEDN